MAVDSAACNPEYQRLVRLQTEAFARNTPYHSLELNDGTVIPGLISVPLLRERLDRYPLPEDLRGRRVLDIGAASGWNSFECERRGAEVVAIDCVEYEELQAVKRLRESKIEYAVIDIEELTPERFGFFDYVLFFGVFYHLRHPLLGLENVCSVTRGVAFIESYVIDDAPDPSRCYMEFYETGELGGQIDNWCGPTTQCLLAMTRSAGFPRADFLYTDSRRGGLVAHRRWEPVLPVPGQAAPFLCSAVNNRHGDIVFQPRKDEYMCLSFFCDEALTNQDVLVEIDEYGLPPIILIKHDAGHWQVNVKVPPGTSPGDHEVRVGTRTGGFSDAVRIRMLPAGAERRYGETPFVSRNEEVDAPQIVRVENTMDRSVTFRGFRNESLECRFTHSDGPLDLSKVQLTVDDNPWPLLSVERPAPGLWQVKARMRGLSAGEHSLRLRTQHSGFSEPFTIASDPVFAPAAHESDDTMTLKSADCLPQDYTTMPCSTPTPATQETIVAWFEHPTASETARAGGKGASLSRMVTAGLPVPRGFVVCADAFREFLESCNGVDFVSQLMTGLDVHNEAALAGASAKIQDLICSNPLAPAIGQAIRDACEELGRDAVVAVRSSAIGEDSEAASFAGQQETFLNVRGADAVERCVKECWASFFAPRAIFYRAQKGILTDTRMAVVVQEMVLATKSGVMFTTDPVMKRRDHMVIEAVFGLGEGIVSGMITPDHYVVDRDDGSLVREFISMQPVAVVHNAEAGGTMHRELSEEEGGARVLSEEQLNALREMGLRLEAFFGAPQDVEWCIRDHDLLLLQSRPITTL